MQKGSLYRNDAYLEYVRAHTPANWWSTYDAKLQRNSGIEMVAHHVRLGGNGGMGVKPSDYRSVPLTDRDHKELHQNGEKTFWDRCHVEPDEVIIALLVEYVKDRKKLMSTLEALIEEER